MVIFLGGMYVVCLGWWELWGVEVEGGYVELGPEEIIIILANAVKTARGRARDGS